MPDRNLPLSIQFLGAAGTVTGSRFLLSSNSSRILVDCGLFQGQKNIRQRNWQPFNVDPATIDAVVLTHAHLDHSGYLPVLVALGFTGKIYCTAACRDLCEILLRDAGKIQEEDAHYRNLHRTTRHNPALPLFTVKQAEIALQQFCPVGMNTIEKLGDVSLTFRPNGHILGSASLDLCIHGKHILFSGDMGRPHDLIMQAPQAPPYCDYLVVESTYGDRLHPKRDIEGLVADIINETARQGGTVLIPSFAVGRAQSILYLLYRLRTQGKIPPLPIYVDSPMSINATNVMIRHQQHLRLSSKDCTAMCENVNFTNSVEQSKAIAMVNAPKIILSASGMATGGRVLHHLKGLLGDSRNSIMFAGYQARGTRGERMTSGEDSIKIHGQFYPVKAQIHQLDFLSAHADYQEIINWLKKIPVAPKNCFVVHGEKQAAEQFCIQINHQLGWESHVAQQGEIIKL